MGILDHLQMNRIFVSKNIPRVAKTANRINRLANIIGDVPVEGCTGAKCIGMGFIEMANFYVKQTKKNVTKAFKNVISGVFKRVDNLKDMVSKEDQEFVDSLEEVVVTKEKLEEQEKDGMIELKKDIHLVQDQITEMNDMLNDLTHIPGCKVIQRQYLAFMDKVSMDDWSIHFKDFKAEFENSRGDFTSSNLTIFFKRILKSKCSKDYQPLKKAFIYIWDSRAMYFFLKCTYYQHSPGTIPAMDIEKALNHELELLDKDLQTAEDAIQTVCFGFFKSLLICKSSGKNLWEAFIDDLDWRQRTAYKCLPEISFWNQGLTNDFKNLMSNEENSMKCCTTVIQHYENLTKQESILDIKDKFPILLNQLEEGLTDYSEEALCTSFKKVFKEKCQNSWDPLYVEYFRIKRLRLMYLDLKLTYMTHIHSSAIDIKKEGDEEKKLLDKDMKTVDNAIQRVCSGFFFAALTAHADWPLSLEFVPDFESFIKDESNFYKTSTLGEIMYGDKSRNTAKVNIYRNSQEPFVLVHNFKHKSEYLYKMNEKEQLKEGMHRIKLSNRDIWIGCRLFWRGDRQEDKVFRLYQFSSSGKIVYEERVKGKEDKDWRTVSVYKFHPDTLSWSKLI